MAYPSELIAAAEYEMRVFERCGSIMCRRLIDEVVALRAQVESLKPTEMKPIVNHGFFMNDTKPRLTNDEIQSRLQAFADSNEQDWSVFDDVPESQQVSVMYPHRIRAIDISDIVCAIDMKTSSEEIVDTLDKNEEQ
jgi:hypothetical protein